MLNGETIENKCDIANTFMNEKGRSLNETIEKEEFVTTMGYIYQQDDKNAIVNNSSRFALF